MLLRNFAKRLDKVKTSSYLRIEPVKKIQKIIVKEKGTAFTYKIRRGFGSDHKSIDSKLLDMIQGLKNQVEMELDRSNMEEDYRDPDIPLQDYEMIRENQREVQQLLSRGEMSKVSYP